MAASRDIIRVLERDGWVLSRVKRSHHVFRHPRKRGRVIVPHPAPDIPIGT